MAGAKEKIMIVAIQQPEHLPWMGFFNKMAQCDLFVYLDNVQFKKRYFENRNKVKTNDGIKWLTVPVYTKGKYTQNISEVIINNELDWRKKYKGLLEYTYKKSNYWIDIKNIVFPCLKVKLEKLVDLNLALIERCQDYLQIETPTISASSLDLDQFSGSDLILEICLKLKADIYLSGPDGRNYLKLNEFQNNGINVVFHDFEHPVYPQLFGDFISHMSIIDFISNCGLESAKIVKNCYLLSANNEN